MDLVKCIDSLNLDFDEYRLSQSVPPHSIIEWRGNDPQPTEAELATAWSEIQANEAATQYQRDRASAYPSLADQADMQYWDAVNGTTTWQDAIAKVKADYPKG